MAKILAGLIAAIAVAVAGFFGFELYAQHRIAGEVETAFAQISAAGWKASHGDVSFDLWSRTLSVSGIDIETAAHDPLKIRIGKFSAIGVSQPDAGRFSATTMDGSG